MRYLLALLFVVNHGFAQDSPRKTTSLNGEWTFHRDGSKETKTVTLPTHWETHEGLKFDGIGWYEKTIDLPELPVGRRLLLHFDAVATHATVYWNDVKLGEHLGGWTPFRFDVTQYLLPSPPRGEGPGVRGSPLPSAGEGFGVRGKRKHTIKVRVDEKVGHNTQGFLPIIAPHFGGIWQGVRLIEVPVGCFDDAAISIDTQSKDNSIYIELPYQGKYAIPSSVNISVREPGKEWTTIKLPHTGTMYIMPANPRKGWIDYPAETYKAETKEVEIQGLHDPYHSHFRLAITFKEGMKAWQPGSSAFYEIKIHARTWLDQQGWDEILIKASRRTITTQGDQFLLNGQPLSIRGVLNWGYYPPSLAPTPTEDQWRSDLKLIKSWGFNLMKCCLWVPPKRLLEIADEEGLLLWIEYPTWHPKLTPQFQKELMQEYKEFHELDRNHPSVILRSLTCETGPGADIKVIQALYDQCKKMAGGLVVDDSSWIEWNRVFDFYDDHPYGNNHTWVATLDRLKKYIATSKYGVKPLCLGEAIAADTWVPTKPMLDAIAKAKADPKQAWSFDERGCPFWVPGFFDANRKWLERMGRVCGGAVDEEKLYQDSLQYAWLMRKYQMETYRREVPNGGYVVSVIRDFPLAGMGLKDYLGKNKWPADDWKWHGDTMLLQRLKPDRHAMVSRDSISFDLALTHFGQQPIEKTTASVEVRLPGGKDAPSKSSGVIVNLQPGAQAVVDIDIWPFWIPMSMFQFMDGPVYLPYLATVLEGQLKNQWGSWVMNNPWREKTGRTIRGPAIQQHVSVLPKKLAVPSNEASAPTASAIVITSELNEELIERLTQGGTVLLLPNGKPGSFPVRSHWYLRGGPFVNRMHPLFNSIPNVQTLLVELQHFDLASDVIPDIQYLEEIDPILMLWDNHDIKEVKTHGLVFETRVGKGRLLVSALNHSGETNAAGKWLLQAFLKHLDSGPPPRNALKPETIARMRAKLNEKKLELVSKPWQFLPDGKNEGLKLGWEKPSIDDKAWKPIKIGQHWEGQGYSTLDGWAWYRLTVEIPKDWAAPHPQPLSPEGRGETWYLNTEGVDDAYEIFINGTKIGQGGDIPNKKTAFEERAAHRIPAGVLKPGEKNVIAVRVYDWYGAGGIHRPMTLSNVPIGGMDILK